MKTNIESLRALLRRPATLMVTAFVLSSVCHPASGAMSQREVGASRNSASPAVPDTPPGTSSPMVYLYQNGVLVMEPDAYVQEGAVYTNTGLLGVIAPNSNNIYDSGGSLIGIVSYSE